MRVADLLFPHDLDPFCDRALEALDRLEIRPTRLHVVHVLPRGREEDSAGRARAVADLRRRLDGGPWTGADVHVPPSSRRRIVDLANALGADLIALPSHGRAGVGRWVLGSVAEDVARFAPCPVLIVPATSLAEDRASVDERPEDSGPGEVSGQVERLAARVRELVAERPGTLTALTVGLPAGEDAAAFESALERQLLAAGIEFVDLSVRPWRGPEPEILVTRFEDGVPAVAR